MILPATIRKKKDTAEEIRIAHVRDELRRVIMSKLE